MPDSVDGARIAVGAASKAAGFRWALLLVFPIGYLGTRTLLGAEAPAYLAWHLIAFASAFLLLVRLRSFGAYYWPIWLGLAAFLLGYYLKFYALTSLAVQPTLVVTLIVSSERLELAGQPAVAIDAFRIATVAFAAFCTVFFMALRPLGPDEGPHNTTRAIDVAPALGTMAYVGLGLLVLTSIVAVSFGILNMAEAQERLPFRLGGWIMYSRLALVTTLGLVLIQFGLKTSVRRWVLYGLLILIGLGLTDTLIRTSRGALLLSGIMIGLIVALASHRLDRRVLIAFAVFGGLTVMLYPIITAYRQLNALTGGGASLALLGEAMRAAGEDGNWIGLTAFQVLQRFMGVDILLFLTDPVTWLGFEGLGPALVRWGSVGKYLTHGVMGIPDTVVFSEAPSLVGWFLMVGGMAGVIVLFPLFLAALWWGWARLWRSRLLTKPVAQVHFLVLWLTMSSEGTLDSMTLHIAAIVASLAAVEWWLRSTVRESTITPLAAAPPAGSPS